MRTVFRFPTLVGHLVPSSPQDLGFHVPGFWPVGLWGLLQVERPAGSLGPPQVCFNITRFIPHICDTSSGSQKTWPSPGVSWLGAWVALGAEAGVNSALLVTGYTKHHCPSSDHSAWLAQAPRQGLLMNTTASQLSPGPTTV